MTIPKTADISAVAGRKRRTKTPAIPRPPRAPVDQPAGFSVVRSETPQRAGHRTAGTSPELLIQWRAPLGKVSFWFGVAVVLAILAFAGVGGFLFLKYETSQTNYGIWFLAVCGGAALLYFPACRLVNRSVLQLEQGKVEVRHGPLPPTPPNVRIDAESITQVYCDESAVVRKQPKGIWWIAVLRGQDGWKPVVMGYEYAVVAVLGTGAKVELARFEEGQDAIWVEQTLEDVLGLEDERVKGAYTGEPEPRYGGS